MILSSFTGVHYNLMACITEQDKQIVLLELSTGKEVRRFPAPASRLLDAVAIGFSADSKSILVANTDGSVWAIRIENGQAHELIEDASTKEFQKSNIVYAARFSRDGKKAMFGDDEGISIWDLDKQRKTVFLPGYDAPVWCVDFDEGGNRILSGGAYPDPTVRYWSLVDRSQLLSIEPSLAPSQEMSISADWRWLAFGGNSPLFWIWDLSAGQMAQAARVDPVGVRSLAFASNSQTPVIGGQYDAHIWAPELGKEISEINDIEHPVGRLALSPDAKTVASALFSRPFGEENGVRVWDVGSHTKRTTLSVGKSGYGVDRLAITPDGKRIAGVISTLLQPCASATTACNYEYIAVWDLNSPNDPAILTVPRDVADT